ncbi:unnamed protein product, partial [Vitis vinifera]|uniref:Uncharacterized protein n=1 Tax=Vitis vinifera TaxID=29760 RepID=D7SI20_VITVI
MKIIEKYLKFLISKDSFLHRISYKIFSKYYTLFYLCVGRLEGQIAEKLNMDKAYGADLTTSRPTNGAPTAKAVTPRFREVNEVVFP